jgi:hypothetical protein
VVEVTVEVESPGETGSVKLQGDTWELRFWARFTDLTRLRGVRGADRARSRSLQVGTCGGVPVWWSEEDGQVTMLVGRDAGSWDVAVMVPPSAVAELVALAEQELEREPRLAG